MTTAAERSSQARIAAHERWAREPDRTSATAPARRAFLARFETKVDPDGTLPAAERAKRAENAMRAHMGRLSRAGKRRAPGGVA